MKNIKLLLFFVLSCLVFAGCTKNDLEVLSTADKVQSNYYSNFINTFCDGDASNIDPNQIAEMWLLSNDYSFNIKA